MEAHLGQQLVDPTNGDRFRKNGRRVLVGDAVQVRGARWKEHRLPDMDMRLIFATYRGGDSGTYRVELRGIKLLVVGANEERLHGHAGLYEVLAKPLSISRTCATLVVDIRSRSSVQTS